MIGPTPLGLSIVVVNWKTRELLLELLHSLLPWTENRARDVEVIVVDNDSGDGSFRISAG